MSVKIRISYETEEELALVQELLRGHIKKLRLANKQTGKYKNAYADLKGRGEE